MLEMKQMCEGCKTILFGETASVFICSYECTFCASCTQAMQHRCPNCGGELTLRPRRRQKPVENDVRGGS